MTRDTATPIEQAIEARWQDEIAFLQKLVQTPSDNPPGDCAAIAEVASEALARLGFDVERHPVSEALVREHGMISCTNLIAKRVLGDGSGPVIALNAHGDVVPPGEGWRYPAYGGEIHDQRLYGRGSAVSKSDIATYAFALLALGQVEGLNGTAELHITFDEEIGGLIGPAHLLDQGLSKPDLCISAGLSWSIVTAHNGCLHLEVTTRGTSAHAAAPESGHDALEAMNGVMSALYGLRAGFAKMTSSVPGIGSPSLTVGLIEGGINTNVVPDRCRIRLDRRMIPEEDPEVVEAALRDVIEKAADRPGISCEIKRVLLARPLTRLDGADPLINAIAHHAERVLGEAIEIKGVPLYTDARLYAERDVPTISYGAGPRSFLEANGHRADEHVRLSDLRAATTIIACALADLLSGDAS